MTGATRRQLLVVHHTTSPSTQAMLESVLAGTRAEGIVDVEVASVAALHANAIDVLNADGYLLGTPINIGYMSGALKHFFDQIYYPCLTAKVGAPYAAFVHSNSDATGGLRGIQAITTGLGWVVAQEAVVVRDSPSKDDLNRCWELGAALAASLMPS
ncbi:flavodoxin family protein [Jatrophihabitans sp. DSM 45814]